MSKDKNTVPDNLKSKDIDIEKYPDHLKTNPKDIKEIPNDADMEKNLEQDPQPNVEYPDNLKTNPEKEE